MKKKIRSTPLKKYNRLFKFLNFDQSLLASFFITMAIFFYIFALWGVFLILEIPVG